MFHFLNKQVEVIKKELWFDESIKSSENRC